MSTPGDLAAAAVLAVAPLFSLFCQPTDLDFFTSHRLSKPPDTAIHCPTSDRHTQTKFKLSPQPRSTPMGEPSSPLRRSDPAVRVRGVAARAMTDGAVDPRGDPLRASTPGRLQGAVSVASPVGAHAVETIEESPPPPPASTPTGDDDDDASLGHLRARNAELRERLREASDDLARARERETAVSGALRAFRERQEKLTRELSSAAATEAEVRRAHERCAELEIEATSRDVETREATRRAEDAESRLAATAVELDETKARLAELVELRAKPVPASPSRSSSSSGRAAESVRDIIVAAAEAAASRKRGLLNGAPKGEGDPSSEDAFASIEESEELERRVHARVEEALAQAQREWRSEMDAMDAERCAEVASLRDALARLRAESDEERLENQFNGESHEKERADAAEARAVLAEERVASAERAAATTAAELATERDRSASLVAELEAVRRERVEAEKERMKNALDSSSSSSSSSSSLVASLRDELEATKRLAAIQEREVVRATHAAAEQAARGGWTSEQASAAAAAAAAVPQALLERWRTEVFRLLLEQRRAPIDAATIAREHVAEVDALRGTIAEVRGALEVAEAARDAAEARARSLHSATADAANKAETAEQRLALERENAQTLARTVASFAAQFDRKCDALENARHTLEGLARRTKFASSRVGLIAALRTSDTTRTASDKTVSENARAALLPPRRDAPKHAPDGSQNVVRELEVEITRLQSERAMLLRELKASTCRRDKAMTDAATRADRAEADAREARDAALAGAADNRRLLTRLERAEACVERLEGECLSLRSRLEDRDAECGVLRDEFEKAKNGLAESARRKLDAAVATAKAEAETEAKSQASGLRREADAARREASRASVAARALERSMEKQRERMEEERAVAVAALEGKVKSLDGVVKELRRERNALLADARAHRARRRLEERMGPGGSANGVDSTPNVSARSSPARSSPPGSRARVSFRDENAAPTTDGMGKVAAARSVRERYDERYDERYAEETFEFRKPPAAAKGRSLGALLESAAGPEGTEAAAAASPRPGVFRNGHDATVTTYDPSSYASPPRATVTVSMEDLEKSPSWQLRRRLQSLEARAARLLEEEEEEEDGGECAV